MHKRGENQMRGIIIVLMAILGVIFPKFLVKAIKSTAGGGLLGSQITFGMLMLIIGIFLNSCI